MKRIRALSLIGAALATAALLTACGGGDDDPSVAGDSSGDVVAKYIGTWESDCFEEGGASGRVRADFTKTSATSFSGNVVLYGYIGSSCSGPSVKDEKVLTNLSMNHAGTKAIAGVTADKFNGASDQGNGKLVMYTDGTTLQLGDIDAGKDAEGYPNSFYESRYTLKRRN
ncbi:hypothetical protein [Hydrogenophaga pseudoflava]|uniref:hypothetical protein n=1 Tax=Hydrogenophaga pseudoflava TaxID=47421 RepID=UPI0027E4B8FF|nr:hypothetical protein [Hydrogenophaga pseudoflava]MDQ7744519.1 hypothetical protein [Hydrogenophaga pseudoflava]